MRPRRWSVVGLLAVALVVANGRISPVEDRRPENVLLCAREAHLKIAQRDRCLRARGWPEAAIRALARTGLQLEMANGIAATFRRVSPAN